MSFLNDLKGIPDNVEPQPATPTRAPAQTGASSGGRAPTSSAPMTGGAPASPSGNLIPPNLLPNARMCFLITIIL